MRVHPNSFAFRFILGLALAPAVALGACTSSGDYVIVTVDARPAVYDAKALTVTLSNGGTTRMDSLALRDQVFPVTFSISAPGRTGDLAITVDATDETGLLVGRGSATTTIAAPDARIRLDSADFVVNTDYAGDQFPSSDFEANGFQLAALPDGTWTTAFRDSCPSGSCTIFARRFDKLGKPVQTVAAAGTNAFPVTASPTTSSSIPAIASGSTTTIAVWDFSDVGGTASGVACRAIDPYGRLSANQTTIAAESADVVSVAALANDTFVASWTSLTAPRAIHAAFIKPDCTVSGGVQTVSTIAGFVSRSSVASSGDRTLFAWILAGSLHTRMASAGVISGNDDVPVAATATEEIDHARVVAAAGGGFVIAVRWVQKATPSGPGRIELFRVSAAGVLVGAPMLVTDKSASDFNNSESFAATSRSDGTVLVAWHTCGPFGDDSMCGVFGRIMRDTGEPVTDVFVIPTTTQGDQKRPSVVGLPEAFVATWADSSMKQPDVDGQSVRARIIYEPGT